MTTATKTQPRIASCPNCGGEIRPVDRLMIGEVLACDRCGTQLEVAGTDPLILEILAKVDEGEEGFVP